MLNNHSNNESDKVLALQAFTGGNVQIIDACCADLDAYADVCYSRMLTYADVCYSRMLTYADVCY